MQIAIEMREYFLADIESESGTRDRFLQIIVDLLKLLEYICEVFLWDTYSRVDDLE